MEERGNVAYGQLKNVSFKILLFLKRPSRTTSSQLGQQASTARLYIADKLIYSIHSRRAVSTCKIRLLTCTGQ